MTCRLLYAASANLTVELVGGRLRLPFGPPGGSWTEAVYADDALRVMRNSRGDTLVLERIVEHEAQ